MRKKGRGCNCKRTRCKKRYCECVRKGIGCTFSCACTECENKKVENIREERENESFDLQMESL